MVGSGAMHAFARLIASSEEGDALDRHPMNARARRHATEILTAHRCEPLLMLRDASYMEQPFNDLPAEGLKHPAVLDHSLSR
jgi:hypothetical protein